MGQNEVKIPTSNNILTFNLNKHHNLQISVHTANEDHQAELQYYQQYPFLELPEDVQQQFHSNKNFFKSIDESINVCCTGGARGGHYRFQFENANIVIRKGIKTFRIPVNKLMLSSQSSKMTIELEEKISLEDRLQRQVHNRKSVQVSDKISAISSPKVPITPLQNHFFRTQNQVYLSLFKKNINVVQAIKNSTLSTSLVTSLDLVGNNVTCSQLKQLMNMDWKSLRKVWLDDNMIDSLEGVNSLARLSFLSIANNLLGEQAAQQMAQIRFTDLKYLKISFIPRNNEKSWLSFLSNDLNSMPQLQKLIIVNNSRLSQKVTKRLDAWQKDKSSPIKRQIVYVIKESVQKQAINIEDSNQNHNRINKLHQYPQF